MSEHLTTDSAEQARQMVEDHGIDMALIRANLAIKWLEHGERNPIKAYLNSNKEKLGYWQEVKQAIEFKIKEDGEK